MEDYASQAVTPSRVLGAMTGLAPTSVPLSQDIIQRTTAQLSVAQEINSRLWQLRDRLLGSPPESTGKDQARPEYSHFAGAWGDRASDLSVVLGNIDSLTAELATRL